MPPVSVIVTGTLKRTHVGEGDTVVASIVAETAGLVAAGLPLGCAGSEAGGSVPTLAAALADPLAALAGSGLGVCEEEPGCNRLGPGCDGDCAELGEDVCAGESDAVKDPPTLRA